MEQILCYLKSFYNWISDNLQWLFSGLGVLILSSCYRYLCRLIKNIYKKVHNSFHLSALGRKNDKNSFMEETEWNNSTLNNQSSKSEAEIKKEHILHLFDPQFLVRVKTEGEYQYQLNVRLRADKKIVIKEISLVNKDDFIGNVSHPSNKLPFRSFIPQGNLDIKNTNIDNFKDVVSSTFRNKSYPVIDLTIGEEEQKSISFIGGFSTIQVQDGYEDLPLNHWSLMATYNINEVVTIPINIKVIGGANGYFWRN